MGRDRRPRLRGKVSDRRRWTQRNPRLAFVDARERRSFSPFPPQPAAPPRLTPRLVTLSSPPLRRGIVRSRWEAWNKAKGISAEVAKKKFVSAYFEMDPKANLYNDNRVKE